LLLISDIIIIGIPVIYSRHGIIQGKLLKLLCPAYLFQACNRLSGCRYSKQENKNQKCDSSEYTGIISGSIISDQVDYGSQKYQYQCSHTILKLLVKLPFHHFIYNSHKNVHYHQKNDQMCHPQAPPELVKPCHIQDMVQNDHSKVHHKDDFPAPAVMDLQKALHKQEKWHRHYHEGNKCKIRACLSIDENKCSHICLISRPQSQQNRKNSQIQ
jgi:hypothetical protein